MGVVVGIDSSTQSCKVEIRRTDDGALLGAGQAPHPPTTPPRSEQDPDAWWAALRESFAAAHAAAGHPAIDAISVAAQQHGLIALDDRYRVLRPAKLWNDTESAPDAAWLVDQLEDGAAGWADACGSVPVASFTITKLSWLHRSEPEVWKQVAHVCLPHDWLTWKLTGNLVTDRGDASGTGYWSPADGRYRWDLLAVVDRDRDWTTVVPPVLAPDEAAGPLTAPLVAAGTGDTPPLVAAGTGDTPPLVAAGTGDNAAAALGLGLGPGDVVISIGTSGTVYAVSDDPVADTTGAVAGFADASGRHLPLVCTLNATGVTDAVAGWLGCTRDELADRALRAPAGADGVVLVPYLAGERTPNHPDASGTMSGLRAGTSPDDLARAAFEGVVCGLLDGLDALRSAGVPTEGGRLFIVGGGSRSPAYRQILADLAQRPVTVPAGDEHVATGACVQAAATLGRVPASEVARAWGLGAGDEIVPDPTVDAAGVRSAYAAARDAAHPR
jgi:xylulokinase